MIGAILAGAGIAILVATVTYEAYRAGEKRGHKEGWDDAMEFCSKVDKPVVEVPYPDSKEAAEQFLRSLDS